MTSVVHFDTVKDHWNWRTRQWDSTAFVYIARDNQEYHLPRSPWANPIKLHSDSADARAAALDQYHTWITSSAEGKALLSQLSKLRGRTLVCYCHPKPCHGDVLLELLGEKVRADRLMQTSMDGQIAQKAPLLLWDDGSAGYQINQDKHGRLHRTSEKINTPWGVPGKAYLTLDEWTRDWIKHTLRVHGSAILSGMSQCEYARFRYTTRLKNLQDRQDYRSNMEREILRELIAELEG